MYRLNAAKAAQKMIVSTDQLNAQVELIKGTLVLKFISAAFIHKSLHMTNSRQSKLLYFHFKRDNTIYDGSLTMNPITYSGIG